MSNGKDSPATVLVVDDEAFSRRFFETILEEQGYVCVTTDTAKDFLNRIDEQDFPDLIILDVRLPDGNGLELLKAIRNRKIFTPIIMITAYGFIGDAVSAMKMGAFDFFTKPFDDTHKIKISIKNALEHNRLSNENRMLRARLHSRAELQNLVGISPKMHRSTKSSEKLPPWIATSWSREKAAPAKIWWPKRSTISANDATSRSSQSIALLCQNNCWKVPCSAMKKEHSPER